MPREADEDISLPMYEGSPIQPTLKAELAAQARRVAAEKMMRPMLSTDRVVTHAYQGGTRDENLSNDVFRPTGPGGHDNPTRNYYIDVADRVAPAQRVRDAVKKFYGSR